MTKEVKLGIPKGSLEMPTIALLQRAGWSLEIADRGYFPCAVR